MSTPEIVIYGASDDLVEVEMTRPDGTTWQEEYNGDDVTLNIGGRMYVRMRYGVHDAVWTAEIGQLVEGIPIIPVSIGTHERGFSVLMEIWITEPTTITEMKKR